MTKAIMIQHQVYDEPESTDYVVCSKVAGETEFEFMSISKQDARFSFIVPIGRPEALDYIREAAQEKQHSIERL